MLMLQFVCRLLPAPMSNTARCDHRGVNMAHLEPTDLNFKLQRPKNFCNIKNEHTSAALQHRRKVQEQIT